MIAHAFVPVGDVTAASDLVSEQLDDDADDLLDYFEENLDWSEEKKTYILCTVNLPNNDAEILSYLVSFGIQLLYNQSKYFF